VDRIGRCGWRSGSVVHRWGRHGVGRSQAVSALNAQYPEAAADFNASPMAQAFLQQFVARTNGSTPATLTWC